MLLTYRQTGFTLIELVITIVIAGIISVVIGRILFQSYQTFQTAEDISETDLQGLLAINRIADDIHTIRSSAAISTIQSNQFVFTDVNGNSVQYQVSSGSLLRNSQALASSVASFNMSYYNKDGSTTASPQAVRFITIALSFTHRNLTQSFSTGVATRGMP